jgi:AraC family ethanolamine operon transcriptional activator
LEVQVGRLGSGNIVEGQSWANGTLLYLPLTNACEYAANGEILVRNSFMVMEPGCEICIATKDEHDWCSIFVPNAKFGWTAPSPDSEQMRCRVTHPNRQAANSFRTAVHQIITAAATCSRFEDTPAAALAVAELVEIASLVVGQRRERVPENDGRPRIPRQEIIRRCRELLEERDGQSVLVGDLAAAADVSERTLQAAFKEYYGVGPIRYLQLKQLHRIRRALQAADPEAVSVTDVLAQHEEWQFGRFASRYRRLFGELPSETLRAERR